MEVCAKCGASGTALKRARLESYEDSVLGNPVTLVNAVERVTCVCGHSVDIIPNQEGLIAAVALCRLMLPYKLNGREIRLLRNALSMKGTEFAKKFSVSPETLSRWETGAEVIGNNAEKYLRLSAAVSLMPLAPAIDVELEQLQAMELSPLRPSEWPSLRLERVRLKHDKKKDTLWDTEERVAA
jgi:DNA-binding transcriptional regulator YiaG